MNRLAAALIVAIAVCVPAILVANGLRVITGDWYVHAVYDHGGVPKDVYGLTREQRTALALTGLHSIRPDDGEGIELLRQARLPGGAHAFNARELRHMSNVRTLLGRVYLFELAALVTIAALAAGLAFVPARRRMPRRAQDCRPLLRTASAGSMFQICRQ